MLIPTHPQNLTDQFIDQQNSSQISQFSFINLTLVSISESIKHENLAKKAMFIFTLVGLKISECLQSAIQMASPYLLLF